MKLNCIQLFTLVAVGLPALAMADAKSVSKKLQSYGAPAQAVIAHRGADMYAPEETAPAFLLASEMGADYLEGDLCISKDGVLVLNHDDTFERTTNIAKHPDPKLRARAKDPVSSFTWAEIQKLDAGSSYNENLNAKGFSRHVAQDYYKGTRILRLEQLMAIARSIPGRNPGIYLEAKARDEFPEEAVQVAKETVEVLKAHGWITGKKDSSRVIFQSFVPEAVKKFKELAPSVLVTYLVPITNTTKKLKGHIQVAVQNNADILGPYIPGVLPDGKEQEFINLVHQAGLGIHPWIIDDAYNHIKDYYWKIRDGKKWAASLFKMGVDGIFSDQPDYGVQLVKPASQQAKYEHGALVGWRVKNIYKELLPTLTSQSFMSVDIKKYELDSVIAKMRSAKAFQ